MRVASDTNGRVVSRPARLEEWSNKGRVRLRVWHRSLRAVFHGVTVIR